jgi:hypothetical protein
MNQSMQPAIQRLFQVSTLEAVSREQLEKFVEEYPCFGYGHYLLLRKLRAENADDFLTTARKTSLHFSNPFWLQWMLENEGQDHQEAAPVHLEEPIHSDIPLHSEEPIHSDIPLPSEGPIYSDIPLPSEEPIHSDIPLPSEEAIRGKEPIQDEEPPFVLDETDQPWPTMESPEIPAETNTLQTDPDVPALAAELLLESIEKAKALRESIIKINEDFQSHNGQPATTDQPDPAPADQPIPAPVEEMPVTPLPHTAALAETTPLFEPLHTIDYFASQGIRLTLDENPTDPLGRQLKSFTEWLRTMRRLPQKDREIVPDRAAEQTIQNFAAHSIEGKEPVTETMAEVLAKQGMTDRARVVYEKLSLLNPDKSAYFAAKIEQLNTH